VPSPITGQLALTGSAQQLTGTIPATSVFSVKAPKSNTHPAFVGPAGVTLTTGYQLDPGDEFNYESLSQNGQPAYQLRPSDFYGVGTSPDVLTWLASPA
jgi:hypothetical protein